MEMNQDLNEVDPAGHVVSDPNEMVDEITQDVDYSEENKQDLGEEIDSLSLKQLQKSNHDQYNYIQKLKKDCEYWQSK